MWRNPKFKRSAVWSRWEAVDNSFFLEGVYDPSIHLSIHPSSFIASPFEGHSQGSWTEVKLTLGGREQGNNLHRLVVHHKADGWHIERNNPSFSHIHLRVIYCCQLISPECLWTVGGSRSISRKPTQTRGEHGNTTPNRTTPSLWGGSTNHFTTVPPVYQTVN